MEAVKAAPLDIAELYTKHKTKLLYFIRRFVQDQDEAEDILQATFVEAIKSAKNFNGDSQPSTWVTSIALNVARTRFRRRVRECIDDVEDYVFENIVQCDADPVGRIEACQMAARVDLVLSKLSPGTRSTFEAVVDGDLTYEEAAELLQIPLGTVRSRVFRARDAARKEIEGIIGRRIL